MGLLSNSRLLGADGPLLRNGLYIMGKTAVPALLGFGFWLIAARALTPVEVGQAAAVVSAMLLVSAVTSLGIGQVYVSRLAVRRDARDWSLTVWTGLLVAGAASLVGGALASILLSQFLPALDGVDLGVFLLLPLGVVGAAWFVLLDHVFIAERDARPAFERNVAAGLARLALVAPVAAVPVDGTTWLVLAWVGTFLLLDAVAVARTVERARRGFAPVLAGWRRELVAIRPLILGHQAINLGAQSSAYVLPILVAARLGAEQNAYFYATFLLASSVSFIAPAISDSLFAEGARRPADLRRDLRRAARLTALLATPPALVLLIAGPQILSLFGPGYAEAGGTLLRILVGAAFFGACLMLATAVLRVRGRLTEGAVATFGAFVVTIGFAWVLLPPLGLEGAGYAWASGLAAGMCAAFVFVRRGEAVPASPDQNSRRV